jgi:hypothetical protein
MEIEELQKKPGRNGVLRRERVGPTRLDSLAMWGALVHPLDFCFASFSTPTLHLDLKIVNIYPFQPI